MTPAPEPGPPILPPPLEPVTPEGPKMSELGRLTGVFVSPGEAFKDIVRRPRWWVPVLIGMAVTMAYLYSISDHIGWEEVIRGNLDRATAGRNMSAQQR